MLDVRTDLAGRALIGALAVLLACCGTGDPRLVDESNSPENAAPVTGSPATLQGADLYAATCAECHGADLRGTDEGPSFLSPVYNPNHHSDDNFRLAVQIGARQHHWRFGNMPPVEGLSEADVEAIIAFVREQQAIRGFED